MKAVSLKKRVLICATGLLVLVFLGWLIVALPILVRNTVSSELSAALNRDVGIRRIGINPFALSVTISGLCISDAATGVPFLAVQQAQANLQVSSIWRKAVVLRQISVYETHVYIVRNGDRTFNFSDLFAPENTAEINSEENAPSHSLKFMVGHVAIDRLHIRVVDHVTAVNHSVSRVNLSVTDISTREKDADAPLSLKLHGRVNRATVNAHATARPFSAIRGGFIDVDISTVDVTHYLPYIPLPPGMSIDSLSAETKTSITWRDIDSAPDFTAAGRLVLTEIRVADVNGEELVAVPEILIDLADTHPLSGDFHIRRLFIDKPTVSVIRESDGTINLQKAFAPATTRDQPAVKATGAVPAEKVTAFRFRLDEFDLNDAVIRLADNSVSTPFRFQFTPISLVLQNIDTAPDSAGTLSLDGETGDGGRLRLTAEFTVAPFTCEVRFDGGPFNISTYAPYYRDLAAVDVKRGSVELGATLRLDERFLQGLRITDAGLRLREFLLVRRSDGVRLFEVPDLQITGAQLDCTENEILVDRLQVQKPFAAAVRLKNGEIDWSTYFPEQPSPDKKNELAKDTTDQNNTFGPFTYTLNHMSVAGAVLAFQDDTVTPAFAPWVTATLTATNVSTKPNTEATIDLEIQSDAAERIAVKAKVTPTPPAAEIELSADAIPLARYRPYFDDLVRFAVADGRISAKAQIILPTLNALDQLRIKNGAVILDNLVLKEKTSDHAFLTLNTLEIDGTDADMAMRKLSIGSIRLLDGVLEARRFKDGTVNLQQLISTDPQPGVQKGGIQAEKQPDKKPGKAMPWSIDLADFKLNEFQLNVEDAAPPTPVSFSLDQLSVTANGLSTGKGNTGRVTLTAELSTGGNLDIEGRAGITPPWTELNIHVDALDLRPLEPYVRDTLNVIFSSGLLAAEGRATIGLADSTAIATFNGDVAVTRFSMLDTTATAQDLISWDNLAIRGIDFALDPLALHIDSVHWDNPFTAVIVGEDGITNLQNISASPDSESVADPEFSADNTDPLPDISLKKFALTNGTIRISDNSVSPASVQTVSALSGTLRDLSLRETSRARLDITGQLGTQGKISLSGDVGPRPLFVDLKGRLAGYQLTSLSPYSQKYIGWGIRQGKLDLTFDYAIRDKKISATNHFILDQFDLGDKFASPDAVKLPLKLGIALLKDRDGVIELHMPIEGQVDDPEFRIGKAVLKVLVNAIAQAATSPFALLGSLVGTKDTLDGISFLPGTADLDRDAKKRLKALANALSERPSLHLGITGVADPVIDRAALHRWEFERTIRVQKLKSMMAAGTPPVPIENIVVTDPDIPILLAAVYKEAKLPQLPRLPKKADSDAIKERQERVRKAVFDSIAIDDDAIRRLAAARSTTVQSYMRDELKIQPDRLFIVKFVESMDSIPTPSVRFYLE